MPTCRECLYVLTHDNCEGCLDPSGFGGPFQYQNFKQGDGIARLLEFQRAGKVNIVIGGEGEHEVNALWSMDQAYKHLANTCEHCGGLVIKDGLTQLLLMKPYGPSFVLEWMHSKLYRISIRRHTPWWEAKPAESI